MATAATQFKLGLLTVLALAAALAIALWIGLRRGRVNKTDFYTYFDESVSGLSVGSGVDFRGVAVGQVAAIRIAPDGRRIELRLAIDRDMARRIDLAHASSDLRAQLGTQGITGVKYIDLDYVDPGTPLPELPFLPRQPYLPSSRSLLDRLQHGALELVRKLPELVDAATDTFRDADQLLEGADGQALGKHLGETLDRADVALDQLGKLLRDANRAKIPAKTARTIDQLNDLLAELDRLSDEIGASKVVASIKRAADALGDAGTDLAGTGGRVQRTLRHLDEAARAVRDLARAIERNPDMLLKGRPRVREP